MITPNNSLQSLLSELERGKFLHDASSKLTDLIGACRQHGRKGSITITIDLEPKSDDAMMISGDVKVKAPRAEKKSSLFFTTESNGITRENPNQREFEPIVTQSTATSEASTAVNE